MNYTEKYPAIQQQIYLNTASCGLLSMKTQQATQQYAQQGSVGRDAWYEELPIIRQAAAKFIGASPSEVALINNFTSSIYQVAQLLQDHRRVLVVADDYPSLLLPWHLLGFEVFTVAALPDGSIPLEAIELSIRQHNIEILAVSHIQYSSGFRLPLDKLSAIRQEHNVKVVVDATQSLGVVPIDLQKTPVDVLIGSGYKWLTAGLGSGILYIHQNLHPQLRPKFLGFGTTGSDFSPQAIDNIPFTPETLEAGHYNFFSLLALKQALSELQEIGINRIFEKVTQLRHQLIAALPPNVQLISNYEANYISSIVVVRASEDAEVQLKAQNIITSTRPKGLRISPHFYNSEADIQQLCSTLAKL
ncbi:aminotransferase class V-fold PLP-dependent enzyme [Tunicatimonas pelagia]|uniref:aminotransferase class V-fold PLP-dependent enzyme n=1 Tax=Tunicatimonas pelagia TaxID=931531 RepID=UPI002664E724|nr:aminotransferase class V-fold PLP-dependent enzyme [Tunicatimonas pelagia]WKN43992.1 aminotransferase class V-fold PLP-dependent enzyme [Tunicatimonas pelagia]